MVENAHGEDGVESGKLLWQMLNAHGQYRYGEILKVILQGEILHDEQGGGVDARHEFGAGAAHAPAVIATAAAHIQHPASGQG